jgi:hypothetical protein
VLTFKEAEPIKNLCTSHSLLVKGSFSHFVLLVPIFFSFMQKFSYRHCSVLLGMTNTTHDTNTALYLWWLYHYERLQWGLADWGHAERIQTHTVTMWCKVLQQWTESRYILITPHIYSAEMNSVMRYMTGIHASLTVRPALLILQMSHKNHKVLQTAWSAISRGHTDTTYAHAYMCTNTCKYRQQKGKMI